MCYHVYFSCDIISVSSLRGSTAGCTVRDSGGRWGRSHVSPTGGLRWGVDDAAGKVPNPFPCRGGAGQWAMLFV